MTNSSINDLSFPARGHRDGRNPNFDHLKGGVTANSLKIDPD